MTTATTPQREIKYDPSTRDYALYLDGDLVGFARTYHDGEVTLDALVCELISEATYAPPAEPAPEMEAIDGEGNPIDPYAPLGECSQCGAAAWTTTAAGLLCPDHEDVVYARPAEPTPEAVYVGQTHTLPEGCRLATDDEPGWYYHPSASVALRITDAPACSSCHGDGYIQTDHDTAVPPDTCQDCNGTGLASSAFVAECGVCEDYKSESSFSLNVGDTPICDECRRALASPEYPCPCGVSEPPPELLAMVGCARERALDAAVAPAHWAATQSAYAAERAQSTRLPAPQAETDRTPPVCPDAARQADPPLATSAGPDEPHDGQPAPAATIAAPRFAVGQRVFVVDPDEAETFGRIARVTETYEVYARVRYEEKVGGVELVDVVAYRNLECVACLLCAGAHPTWHCPTIAAERLRQTRRERAGQGVVWLFTHDRARFLRSIAHCNDSDRRALADATAAYMATFAPAAHTPLDGAEVLQAWMQMIAGETAEAI